MAVLRAYVCKRNEEHNIRSYEEVAAKIAPIDTRLERTSEYEVSPLNDEIVKAHEDRQVSSDVKQGDDSGATAQPIGKKKGKEAKPLKVLEVWSSFWCP